MVDRASETAGGGVGLSRRGLVRAGAIAMAGVPAAGISGRIALSSAPLEGMSYEDWTRRAGMVFLTLGEGGPSPLTVLSITPMDFPGARPASLPRATAFEVLFRGALAGAPSGNATYEVWMGSIRSSLFLSRRADQDGEAVFSALFN